MPPAVTARRLILWAALLGCLARAAFGLIYWHGKPLTHDEREYLALAANLIAGRGFTQVLPGEPAPTTDVQQYGRAPTYPLFLTPLTIFDADLRAGRMPAEVPWAIKVAQALVGGLGVWLMGAIAARLAGDRAGAIAALIGALYPPLVWTAAFALSETLYSTLALACVWILGDLLDGRAEGRHPARRALAGGLIAGVAILARPVMMLFLPFALLLALRPRLPFTLPFDLPFFAPPSTSASAASSTAAAPRAAQPRAWRWSIAFAIVFGVALMVLPWTARNIATYGRFVLIASDGGVTFWTGNHPLSPGEGDLAANPELKRLNVELRRQHAGLTEEELEPIYYREAFAFIRNHPGQWLWLLVKKVFYTWVPIGPSYRLHSPLYFWGSVIPYCAVLPFAVLGSIRLWRTRRQPWTLWSMGVAALLVFVIFIPQERFRIPVVDPTLIICAGVQLARPGSRSFADDESSRHHSNV